MLVLSRKEGEEIRIGKDIALTVVAVKGNRVRIGIQAPREYSIQREELIWNEDAIPVNTECELELTAS